MTPITEAELAAVCRTADPDAVAGFVADLYEARGRSVERGDGPVFTLLGDGDPVRVCVPGGEGVPADADAVVVAGRSLPADAVGDARPIDADRLRNALLYAVDRPAADCLLDRWFDRPLDSFEGDDAGDAGGAGGPAARDAARGPAAGTTADGAGDDPSTRPTSGDRDDAPDRDDTSVTASVARVDSPGPPSDGGAPPRVRPADGDAVPRGRPADGNDGSPAGRRTLALAAGGLVVLMAALALAGLVVDASPGLGPGNGTDTPTASPGPSSPVPALGEDSDVAAVGVLGGERDVSPARTATRSGALPAPVSPFPPGVDGAGLTDYQRLVAAHRALLENDSYRATLVAREFVDGEATGVFSQTVRVENATRYRVTTTRLGEFESPPPALAEGTVFADGTERFERTSGGVRRLPVSGTDPFLGPMTRYLGYYLSVEESWIAGREVGPASTTVRLATEGDPWPGVTNATGDALLTESGLVRVIRRAYDDPNSRARVVVTLRVSDVGRTTVSRPDWVREG